jgi:CDP-glycerol glycerophosphotransferase
MNKNVYFWNRLSLYLFSVVLTIISFLVKKDNKRIIFNSFLNQRFSSNSKYLFLYFIENIKSYNSYFVINNEQLRNKLNRTIGNYFIETKSLLGKMFVLKASIWFISSLDLPVGGFFLAYKRNVIHLGHGTPLKNIGLLENKISLMKKIYYAVLRTNISYTVASSNFFVHIISRFLGLPREKILIAGQARNDQLFLKAEINLKDIVGNENMKNILYAPTWRTFAKVKLFPFEDFILDEFVDFLVKNKINIFIRTHPYFEDEVEKELLNMPNIYSFSGEKYYEIMDYLNLFDLLITDYSSIYFDYLLLNRPLVFLPYDYDSYNNEIGFVMSYYDYTPGYKPSTMEDFINAISEAFTGEDKYKDARYYVNSICNLYQQNNRREFVFLLYELGILSSLLM